MGEIHIAGKNETIAKRTTPVPNSTTVLNNNTELFNITDFANDNNAYGTEYVTETISSLPFSLVFGILIPIAIIFGLIIWYMRVKKRNITEKNADEERHSSEEVEDNESYSERRIPSIVKLEVVDEKSANMEDHQGNELANSSNSPLLSDDKDDSNVQNAKQLSANYD